MKIFGVTGWKNSGKTGLMERLITEFTARGLSVSSIKHAHHSFDIDHPGRDSYRHRDAGARQVLLASRNRWALMHELRNEDEPSLGDLLKQLLPVDLVLIEGYKRDRHPKIEAHRKETGQPLIAPEDETIVAVASDTSVTIDRPVLDLNDTASIANFIAQHLKLDPSDLSPHASVSDGLHPYGCRDGQGSKGNDPDWIRFFVWISPRVCRTSDGIK
ncbi:MAG: molybdopterin-guanine dinucleotide biosynthesis protein B [Rhodobacteraceae bacterium]|nr:molybdopterin-guanine dinucleotide biosynthesis protein B [Paracoccaceae bacterium]